MSSPFPASLLSALAGPVLALFLFGCATTAKPLVSRGLPADERKHYIIQNGYGIPEPLKNSFLDGYPDLGMSRELIFQLYGAPDRSSESDATWEYVNRRGQVVTGFKFQNEKVTEIYGDRNGGLPPAPGR